MALLGKTLLNLDAVSLPLDPATPVREIMYDHVGTLLRRPMQQAVNPSRMASELLEAFELGSEVPCQVKDAWRKPAARPCFRPGRIAPA